MQQKLVLLTKFSLLWLLLCPSWAQEEQEENLTDYQREEIELYDQFLEIWALPEKIYGSVEAQTPTTAELEQAKQRTAGDEEGENSSQQLSLGEFLAIGQVSLDVIFFSYSRQKENGRVFGQTKGIFSAKEVLRADRHRLHIKQLEAELFGENSQDTTTWFAVDQGDWYLPLNQLISDFPTEIRRSNLRIVSEGCLYSGSDQALKLFGNCYTEIFRIPATPRKDPLDPSTSITNQTQK